jgi:hypothetical protein
MDDEKPVFDFAALLDSGDLLRLTVANTAAIPLMITRAQKARLHDMGYTDAEIFEMAPADAHAILAVQGSK